MQPLKPQTYVVQNFLIAAATALAVVGFLFGSKIISFHPAVFGYIAEGEFKQGIYLGMMPLSVLATFASFICLYLLFEMYSFKNAFYALLSINLVLAGTFGLTLLLKTGKSLATENGFDLLLNQLFVYRDRAVAAQLAGLLGGVNFILILAALIKRITSGYFMFFRFAIAAPIGFALLVAIETFLLNFDRFPPKSLIVLAATPAAQYIVLSLICLPGLYVLRLFLGLFRGSLKKALASQAAQSAPAEKPSTTEMSALTKKATPPTIVKKTRKSFFGRKAKAVPTPAESSVAPPPAPSAANGDNDSVTVYDLSDYVPEDEVSISGLFQNKAVS